MDRRSDDRDMFLVLATDGVWDVVGNEELGEMVESGLYRENRRVDDVAEEVLDNCLEQGSMDNMAVIIVKT